MHIKFWSEDHWKAGHQWKDTVKMYLREIGYQFSWIREGSSGEVFEQVMNIWMPYIMDIS